MFKVFDCWTDADHEEWFTRAWQGDGLMGQEGKIWTYAALACICTFCDMDFLQEDLPTQKPWTFDVNYLWNGILMLPARALQILASTVLRGIPSDHQTVYGVRKPMWINTWRREDMIETGMKPCISECNKVRSDIFLFNWANQNQISDFGWGFLVALTISFLGSTSQRRALQLDSPQYHWPWHCGIHVQYAILAWEKYKHKF